MKKNLILAVIFSSLLLFSSCLGSFSAFNHLKEWNENATDSEILNNVIFWGLNIIPVYPLFLLSDVAVFNVVEFWSGSNPIAMEEGKTETQIAVVNGQKVKMTAKKNSFIIEVIEGESSGKSIEMMYTPNNKTWNAKDGDKLIKLASFKEGFYMVYTPDGDQIKLNADASVAHNNLILEKSLHTYRNQYVAEK